MPVSVSEGYAVDGFVLTSDHVITLFQDPEGPPAESGTSLLKEREESPEVSKGLRGTAKPPCPQPLPGLAVLPEHSALLPVSQMGDAARVAYPRRLMPSDGTSL